MKQLISKKINAVIGHPLGHSLSPAFHNWLNEKFGFGAVFKLLPGQKLESLVARIRNLPISLTAVTMPYKQSIMPFLDRLDKTVKVTGSVNTVINRNGKLIGYNTDVFGIDYALRNTPVKGRKVLLIGAGGAARAVACVIHKKKGKLLYFNRTRKKAQGLMNIFSGRIIEGGDLKKEKVDIIINATPIGMGRQKKILPIKLKLLNKRQTIFDLVYNPVETLLLQAAKKIGAKTILGLEMFIAQGLRQEELLLGRKFISNQLILMAKRQMFKELNEN